MNAIKYTQQIVLKEILHRLKQIRLKRSVQFSPPIVNFHDVCHSFESEIKNKTGFQ